MIDLKIKSTTEMTSRRPAVHCKNFIPLLENSVTMLFAGGGVGKSYSSIRIAIEYAIETGNKAVLWLTEDSEGENKYRFDSLCNEYPETNKSDLQDKIKFIGSKAAKFSELEDGNARLTREFWEIRLLLSEYGLVVIDPLLQFNGCDENSNTHAGVVMGALKEWADEEKKVILLLHHATKTKEGDAKPRGAGEWVNGCRAVYNAGRPKFDSNGSIEFTLTKNNGIAWCFMDSITKELKRTLNIFPPHQQEQYEQETEPTKPFLSIASHNSVSPEGFIKVEVDYFYEVHKLVSSGNAYSQYNFKDGYRLGANNQGNATMVCLDYDDGMTIERAKKKFSSVQSLIITTRSHQKDKSGQKCDRFRVIMPLDSPLSIPLSDYPDFFDCLNETTGGEVDKSTKDLARFYFASPEDATYHYSDSEKRMNWRLIYEKMKKARVKKNIENKIKEQSHKKYQSTGHSREPRNTLPKDTIFEDNRKSITFSSLRDSLSIGEKFPCKCINGIDHGSLGKDHLSAFVKKDSNGNVFYSCSGGRCAGNETKWCED